MAIFLWMVLAPLNTALCRHSRRPKDWGKW